MKRFFACLPAALLIAVTLNAQENGGQLSLLNGLNSFANSSANDSVYFLKGGINIGVQGNYFWRSIGVAGRVGYFTNNASEQKLADFGESRKASAERSLLATKPYKGFYFMAGPAFQTRFSRWQVESNVLGGVLHNDDAGVFIGDRAQPDLVYYRNKIEAGSAFAWNVGFGINYSLTAPIRVGISADYLSTQSSVVNTDINRNNGTSAQSLTSQASFLSTAVKLTYSLNSTRHYDNRNTWRKSTVKSTNSNPGKISTANSGPAASSKNNDCDCENKVRDILFLDPLTVDITFNQLSDAQNFLKSGNPLYTDKGNAGENPLYTNRDAASGLATGRRQHKPVMANYDEATNTFELNGRYYVPTTREAGSGMATGRRQYEPLKQAAISDGEYTESGTDAPQGMMVRTANGEQVFAVLPSRINLQRVSYLQGGAISVHVKNENGQQNTTRAQNNNTVRSNRTDNAFKGGGEDTNSQQKVADHNSSRSNKTASVIDDGGNTGAGGNTLKAQNNNTVRSNRTDNALKGGGNDTNSQQKVADHNSSRSNKTASVIDDGGNTGAGGNTLKAQNNNTVRSNRTDNALKDGNDTNSQQKVADHNSSRSNKTGSLIDSETGPVDENAALLDLVLYTDASGNTTAKFFHNRLQNAYSTREAGSGLATGRRQHYPLTANWNETDDILTIGDNTFENVKVPRDAASGLATGKRTHKPVTVIVDGGTNTIERDGEYYAASTRDAASGLATGRRTHKPMTVMFDEDADEIDINGTIYREVRSARETGSGIATGKRTSFAVLLGNTDSSTTQRVLPTVNKRMLPVRVVAGDEATAKAIISNTSRGGSATLNTQTSSRIKQTQGSSFGEKIMAGDPIPGLEVLLKKTNGGQLISSTDENGFILAEDISEGEYVIQQVYKGSWKNSAVAVKVTVAGNSQVILAADADGDGKAETFSSAMTTGEMGRQGSDSLRHVWGDPHVDTGDGHKTSSTGSNLVYTVNNSKPVRCVNGQCELLCTVIVDGKEHEAVITAVLKTSHEMQMGAIRNLK